MSDAVIPDPMAITVGEGVRRQPIYFLLDNSKGMTGAPIESVRRGVDQFLLEVQDDTFALETTWVGIITFGGRAEFVTKGLVPFGQLVMPPLTAGGQNVLGEALQLLGQSLDQDIKRPVRGRSEKDWMPVVFIMLGSEPADNWREPRNKILRSERTGICKVVTVGCGPYVNYQIPGDIAVGEMFDIGDSNVSLFGWLAEFMWGDAPVAEVKEETGSSIVAMPSIIDFGCIPPGTSPCVTVRIEGGPAKATTNNERIQVTPTEVGEEPTEVEITVRDGSDGELIWDSLYIKGAKGEIEMPVICLWDEALSRSFKEPIRRKYIRKTTKAVKQEPKTGVVSHDDGPSKDETEPANSTATGEYVPAGGSRRTYIARCCPYCGKNFRYDSDNRMWLKCETCAGARKLVSVLRRAKALTKLGIVYAKQDLKEIWNVITGKQDWNLK